MVEVQNKRIKETTSGQITQQSGQKIGIEFTKRNPNPQFLKSRLEFFDSVLVQQKENIQKKADKQIPIKVTLKSGKIIEGIAFKTTSRDICTSISNQLEKKQNITCAKILYSSKVEQDEEGLYDPNQECADYDNDDIKEEIYDLHRPLEGDCTIDLVGFEDKVGKSTFWHSSAHILGAAIEQFYGSHLCIGPPLSKGFYYDSYMGEVKIADQDYKEIEKIVNKFVKENHVFEKVILTKQQALELFKDNPFKVSLINGKIKDDQLTSAYKCGDLIDLCTGPHLTSVNKVKAFKVTAHSSCYWLGDNKNDSLQRMYGISFSSKKELDEWIQIQEELKKRDHRNIGTQNQLFFFHPQSAGSCFFYPKGTHIYNKLQNLIRTQGKLRGYQEVITPNMYNSDL